MSEKRDSEQVPDESAASPSWVKAWPFLLALTVVVVAVAWILISNLTRPAADRADDSGQVNLAINEVYTARNSLDFGAYKAATCSQEASASSFPSEQTFVDDNRRSRDVNGVIVIPEITDVNISGEQATATVHWNFKNRPDEKHTDEVSLVRENDTWKVCKA